MKLSKKDLLEIEEQLSCPTGESGILMGENMNESNINMTLSSIKRLKIENGDSILEIGHGNAAHLSKVIEKSSNISYTGLEISETMKNEAERINNHLVHNHEVKFLTYNGDTIPFPEDSFNKIFSVNTIYFWKNPKAFLNEIKRVLKPSGILILTFAKKEFMQNLPFVNQKFNLYDSGELHDLTKKVGLLISETINKTDQVKSKAGDLVNREFVITKIGTLTF